MTVGVDLLLVSPVKVAARLGTLWMEPGFWSSVLFSLGRIGGGFLLAFGVGCLAAAAAGRFPVVEVFLRPYVVSIKAVPVASFIIISLIWLRAGQLAAFIAFLMVFPVVYSNVLQGLKSTDRKLLEMAELYRVPWRRRLVYLYLPQTKPYILSAASVGMGLAWKAGVAAEVIAVANGSIGDRLYEAKIYFQTADLLAWTVVIVLLSVGCEKLLCALLRLAFREVERR